jgi:hypothetical protein
MAKFGDNGLVSSAQSFINKQLGFDSATKPFGGLQNVPWSDKQAKDPFWNAIDIDTKRWNRFYPYRLVVYDIAKGAIVGGASGALKARTETLMNKVSGANGGLEYIISQEPMSGSWIFNFPITPQQYSVTDQFAISTSATARGIVEEHNGIKFKMITMAGTTGIWPQRPVVAGVPKFPTILGGLAGNTLENLGNVLRQGSNVAKAFTGEGSGPTAQQPGDTSATLFSTGYFYALYLGQFLERYAQEKKKPENKNWRLVLDVPKENQSFIVTPVQFSLNKSQQKPNEYMWSMQLKAWKRIDLDDVPFASNKPLNLGTPNILSRLNNTIRETRRLIGASTNLVKAVRSDFQKPLNSLRQTALAVKDLGGFVFTVADLPRNIIGDYKNSISDSLFIARNSFKRDSEQRASGGGSSVTGVTTSSIKASSLEAKAGSAINALSSNMLANEGLSGDAVAAGALGLDAAYGQDLDPLNNVFANPEENFDLFDGLDINNLVLSPEQQQAIDNELENAALINQDDLLGFRQDILDLALSISNIFGAGDDTYSQIYGRPVPKERVNPMTVEENEILTALFEAIQVYDILTSTKLFDDQKNQNPLEYVGGLADQAGIDFLDSTSKFLAPVPFGLTIEEIAARYMGNPDRWVEISTLNKLRSPYIDEEGFTYPFLSNATGRQFNVNDSENKLYVDQKIVLFSSVVPQVVRKITNIEKISDTNYLITVDGAANLDNLATTNGATMRGYLPGTVNSQDQIYIPSDLPAEADDRIKTPSAFQNDKLTKISKIDWLLTDDGDLAVNGVGDFRLANGLNNLVQALKLKIRTKKGTLLRHLEFGIGIQHGMSVADVESGVLLQELTRLVTDDERFSGIERLDISLSGNTLKIDMAVTVANSSGIIPISFDL